MIEATQLALFPERKQKCHFKGCVNPPVCSSTTSNDAYVCTHHNDLEWARSLARNKNGGYWQYFGKRWLAELEGKHA